MTVEAPLSERRVGRDELNLTEFPFALISDRPSKDRDLVLSYQDGAKEWRVSGDPELGLPTAGDVEVYVVLMELTREQGFPVRVSFCRHDVVRRLGWNVGGKSYDRFMLSLRRLVGVTIRTKNAFWDAQNRVWERERAFHILEAYDVTDSRQSRPEERSLFPSWIRWSPELYQNIQAGHIKALDVDLFLSLHSSISQALYRYLDAKKYDGKPQYRIGIRKLAWEHLGLSRNYSNWEIKSKLGTAHTELTERGFLLSAEYAPMKSGEEMVVYRFPVRAAAQLPAPAPAPELCPLGERLVQAGVSRQIARQLAQQSPEACEEQLRWLSYRKAKDPGAALVAAIRDGWAAPPAWMQEQERTARRRTTTGPRSKPAAAAPGAASPAASDWDEWWASLPAERQEQLQSAALAELKQQNRMLGDLAERHPTSPLVRENLRLVLRQLAEAA